MLDLYQRIELLKGKGNPFLKVGRGSKSFSSMDVGGIIPRIPCSWGSNALTIHLKRSGLAYIPFSSINFDHECHKKNKKERRI